MPFLSNSLQEVQITSRPIFEGYLSVKLTNKNNWQWRLFRFDGTHFTCLKSKKLKIVDNSVDSLYKCTNSLTEDNTHSKYYQLPEWTVDLNSIQSISILKKKKNNKFTRCFSIKTCNDYFILKASKQKDLERWLFVLTKMWQFTQMFQQQLDDNIPLAHSIYNKPVLSTEKIKVIDEWRKNLAELMANDPLIRLASPPSIVPIPDDDTMSVFTDMTSVSNRNIKPIVVKRKSSVKRVPTLKKKRSDEVRNWMNTTAKKDFNYFQDVVSVLSDKEVEEQPTLLKYHTSIKGKKINQQDIIKKRRASMPLTNDEEEEEEEDMSLAELQKSLQKINLRRYRSPSASSIHDLMQQSSSYYLQPQYPLYPLHQQQSFYPSFLHNHPQHHNHHL